MLCFNNVNHVQIQNGWNDMEYSLDVFEKYFYFEITKNRMMKV